MGMAQEVTDSIYETRINDSQFGWEIVFIVNGKKGRKMFYTDSKKHGYVVRKYFCDKYPGVHVESVKVKS